MKFLLFVFCILCVNIVFCGENSYRAAVLSSHEDFTRYSSVIREAGKLNADIIVLPPINAEEVENYDEIIKTIAASAKQASIYVVTHLFEKANCQNKDEVIRSNLAFDRTGDIIAVYRKPVNPSANCTTVSRIPTFSTDFGVTFGLMMEEDLVLQRPEELGLKNYVVVGGVRSEIPAVTGSHFTASWAHVSSANLLTPGAIFPGDAGPKTAAQRVSVVNVDKYLKAQPSIFTAPSSPSSFPHHLDRYIIRPLDLEATKRGYSDKVCHGKFCCDFYVKTVLTEQLHPEVHYSLSVFSGAQPYSRHNIGVQVCSVVACAGLYKRSCDLGLNNSTNTIFEKLIISANFTKDNSAQFPTVLSTETQKLKFETDKNTNAVTLSIKNGKNLQYFGIFGRDYSKDEEILVENVNETVNYYDYFFDEDVMEFFDYLWIRVRIVAVIVTIYVLEML